MTDAEIVPGVFEKTWEAVEGRIQEAIPFAKTLHIYLSDGTLGTTETFADPERFKDLVRSYPDVVFEAHILSANPEKLVRQIADSGFRRVIAHVEANDPRRFLELAKYDEVEVGIAIDGATEVEQVEPFLEAVDFVVVMTAEAGDVGGDFLPETLEKIKLIHGNFPDLPIECVGGITDRSIKAVKDTGATRIVSTKYLYDHGIEGAIAELERA